MSNVHFIVALAKNSDNIRSNRWEGMWYTKEALVLIKQYLCSLPLFGALDP